MERAYVFVELFQKVIKRHFTLSSVFWGLMLPFGPWIVVLESVLLVQRDIPSFGIRLESVRCQNISLYLIVDSKEEMWAPRIRTDLDHNRGYVVASSKKRCS